MTIDFTALTDVSNLLLETPLEPLQGGRFQPTGFPDLGAAVFQTAAGEELLVESAQSMANRLEAAIWDDEGQDLIGPVRGLSYIRVEQDNRFLTSSIVESHRINSPYILESKDKTFFNRLREELGVMEVGPVNNRVLAEKLAYYDICSLIHGVFLAKKELAGGRLRVPRALSAFIEARDVRVAASGGVKLDRVDPQGDTKKGFGNVPFSRDEYNAGAIIAYFNIDLAQIRGYRLGREFEELAVALSLYKIRLFLDRGLRLRTACYFKALPTVVTQPDGFQLPTLPDLEAVMPGFVKAAAGLFGDQPVTTVRYEK